MQKKFLLRLIIFCGKILIVIVDIYCLVGGSKMKIACLGPRGTFSHIVLQNYMSGKGEYSEHLFPDFQSLTDAVKSSEADIAVCPVENSQEGAVNQITEALALDGGIFMNGEYLQKVSQCLLAPIDSNSADIKIIFSNPQAVGQCRNYLGSKFPGVEYSYTDSTAAAAEAALANGLNSGVVGSEKLRSLYPLTLIEEDIQDNKSNFTRFAVISKNPEISENGDKTSIAFGVKHEPGGLNKILSVFDVFGINMLKIESHPSKISAGEYIFLADFEGNCMTKNVSLALKIIKKKAKYYKLIGCYKSFRLPE